MPIYEYECRACGAHFEKIAPSSATHMECPDCDGRAERVPSTFGIGGGTGKSASSSSGSGCAGCHGKSCATCH